MIPILFEANAKNFDTYGIGVLRDATSCEITEERNGPYELTLKYPINGSFYAFIRLPLSAFSRTDFFGLPLPIFILPLRLVPDAICDTSFINAFCLRYLAHADWGYSPFIFAIFARESPARCPL